MELLKEHKKEVLRQSSRVAEHMHAPLGCRSL
jgi:hypothetical protein